MTISHANASWEGSFKTGRGTMKPEHAPDIPFSVGTRFEGQKGSNPEELVGAALAGCYSMALALGLEKAGITPENVRSTARVHLEREGEGYTIKRIDLSTEVRAKGADEAKFRSIAEATKVGCPIGKVLRATEIVLEARLVR